MENTLDTWPVWKLDSTTSANQAITSSSIPSTGMKSSILIDGFPLDQILVTIHNQLEYLRVKVDNSSNMDFGKTPINLKAPSSVRRMNGTMAAQPARIDRILVASSNLLSPQTNGSGSSSPQKSSQKAGQLLKATSVDTGAKRITSTMNKTNPNQINTNDNNSDSNSNIKYDDESSIIPSSSLVNESDNKILLKSVDPNITATKERSPSHERELASVIESHEDEMMELSPKGNSKVISQQSNINKRKKKSGQSVENATCYRDHDEAMGETSAEDDSNDDGNGNGNSSDEIGEADIQWMSIIQGLSNRIAFLENKIATIESKEVSVDRISSSNPSPTKSSSLLSSTIPVKVTKTISKQPSGSEENKITEPRSSRNNTRKLNVLRDEAQFIEGDEETTENNSSRRRVESPKASSSSSSSSSSRISNSLSTTQSPQSRLFSQQTTSKQPFQSTIDINDNSENSSRNISPRKSNNLLKASPNNAASNFNSSSNSNSNISPKRRNQITREDSMNQKKVQTSKPFSSHSSSVESPSATTQSNLLSLENYEEVDGDGIITAATIPVDMELSETITQSTSAITDNYNNSKKYPMIPVISEEKGSKSPIPIVSRVASLSAISPAKQRSTIQQQQQQRRFGSPSSSSSSLSSLEQQQQLQQQLQLQYPFNMPLGRSQSALSYSMYSSPSHHSSFDLNSNNINSSGSIHHPFEKSNKSTDDKNSGDKDEMFMRRLLDLERLIPHVQRKLQNIENDMIIQQEQQTHKISDTISTIEGELSIRIDELNNKIMTSQDHQKELLNNMTTLQGKVLLSEAELDHIKSLTNSHDYNINTLTTWKANIVSDMKDLTSRTNKMESNTSYLIERIEMTENTNKQNKEDMDTKANDMNVKFGQLHTILLKSQFDFKNQFNNDSLGEFDPNNNSNNNGIGSNNRVEKSTLQRLEEMTAELSKKYVLQINTIHENIKTISDHYDEKIGTLFKWMVKNNKKLHEYTQKIDNHDPQYSNSNNNGSYMNTEGNANIGRIKCLVCDQPVNQLTEADTVFGGPSLFPTLPILRRNYSPPSSAKLIAAINASSIPNSTGTSSRAHRNNNTYHSDSSGNDMTMSMAMPNTSTTLNPLSSARPVTSSYSNNNSNSNSNNNNLDSTNNNSLSALSSQIESLFDNSVRETNSPNGRRTYLVMNSEGTFVETLNPRLSSPSSEIRSKKANANLNNDNNSMIGIRLSGSIPGGVGISTSASITDDDVSLGNSSKYEEFRYHKEMTPSIDTTRPGTSDGNHRNGIMSGNTMGTSSFASIGDEDYMIDNSSGQPTTTSLSKNMDESGNTEAKVKVYRDLESRLMIDSINSLPSMKKITRSVKSTPGPIRASAQGKLMPMGRLK